jgi:hypothetical protein
LGEGQNQLRRLNVEDFQRLNERVDRMVEKGDIADRSQGLIYLFLMHRFYADKGTIDESITDGGNDCGIDAIYIDRRGDEPTIHLFQSKYHESSKKAKNFPASSLEKIIRFFEILKDRRVELQKIANPRLEQKILEIRDAISREFPTFKVWLLSNGLPCIGHEAVPCCNALARQSVSVEEFHLNEIVEFCLNTHSGRANHVFYARDAGVIEFGNTELRSVVGYISGLELYKLLADIRDERKIDYTLFSMNVRGFLGLDNPVNKEIFRTAASSDNANFASLNNGITIVGSQCRVNRTGSDMPKIGIKRLSIVNGAQTCSAIFDAMRDFYPDVARFEKLSVLFRVFETEDPNLINKIAVSTNNQNRINPRDLRANDDSQTKLEVELKAYQIRYLRKRGFYEDVNDTLRLLDSLKAGQILLSYIHHDPVRAKRDSDLIFTDLYLKVFGSVDVQGLVDGLDWFDLIEKKRVSTTEDEKIKGVRNYDNSLVTYGSFHILMLCNLLGGGAKPSEREGIIDQAIGIIRNQLVIAGNPALYLFFRDSKQAEILKETVVQPSLI